MEYLWLIYWGLLLFSFIFGIVVIIKKNKTTGVLESLLSLITSLWAFIFALKRDYLSIEYSQNEIKFLYDQVIDGNVEAILIVLLFIILFLVLIYNLFLFKKKH